MVPEEHPSMATMFEHLEPHKMPTSTNVLSDLPIAPTVQAIVVDCITVVDPQVAPIIGDNAEMVMACPVESHAACPTHSKVIASVKPWPLSTCVAIVDIVLPTSHIRPAPIQVLAIAPLTEVESVLHKETMPISDFMARGCFSATCTRNCPPVASIGSPVPEQHPSMTTMFKHLKPHKMPSAA